MKTRLCRCPVCRTVYDIPPVDVGVPGVCENCRQEVRLVPLSPAVCFWRQWPMLILLAFLLFVLVRILDATFYYSSDELRQIKSAALPIGR